MCVPRVFFHLYAFHVCVSCVCHVCLFPCASHACDCFMGLRASCVRFMCVFTLFFVCVFQVYVCSVCVV